eukprot:UN11344
MQCRKGDHEIVKEIPRSRCRFQIRGTNMG